MLSLEKKRVVCTRRSNTRVERIRKKWTPSGLVSTIAPRRADTPIPRTLRIPRANTGPTSSNSGPSAPRSRLSTSPPAGRTKRVSTTRRDGPGARLSTPCTGAKRRHSRASSAPSEHPTGASVQSTAGQIETMLQHSVICTGRSVRLSF